MLAIRLRQKESIFYLAAYRASDLLRRVQFVGKSYEGEDEEPEQEETVVNFFRKVRSGSHFFQRRPYARKVRQIAEFYGSPMGGPRVSRGGPPGTPAGRGA